MSDLVIVQTINTLSKFGFSHNNWKINKNINLSKIVDCKTLFLKKKIAVLDYQNLIVL